MRASRKFVFLVGVTLGVAPIFSSVWAQQLNQQATMLMEMQALRAEIAELRDMVERQQYQLRRLQRGSQGNPSVAVAPAAAANLPATAAVSYDPDAQATLSEPTLSEPTVGASQVLPSPTTGNEADFYPPNTVADSGFVGTDLIDDVVIEERIIGRTTEGSSTGVNNGFPPVEERAIGRPTDRVPQTVAGTVVGTVSGAAVQQPANTQQQTYPQTEVQTLPSIGVVPVPIDQAASNRQIHPNIQVASPTTEQAGTLSSPAVINQASTESTLAVATVLSEQDYYQQGFELLKQSKHPQAVTVFKQQISSYPQGGLADDAHYWVAESMYVNRSLDISKHYFKAIIDNFAQSPRLPDAMLKTAYIEQEQGNRIEARILLQEIIQFHPRSNAAISAKNRLEELN